jgi:hypothetical protein
MSSETSRLLGFGEYFKPSRIAETTPERVSETTEQVKDPKGLEHQCLGSGKVVL